MMTMIQQAGEALEEQNKPIAVSVIVPVFNTARYLRQCLDSLVNQTLKEMEFICVDDGSTDGSGEILDMYAEKYPSIKVIHKKNGGVVSARRRGEAAANGAYIGYVDSDDWVEPDMYRELYGCATENQVEMVTSGCYMEGNYTSELYDGAEGGLYEAEEMPKLRENTIYCMQKKDLGLRGSLCYKLFSKKLLERGQFQIPEDLSMSEDKMQMLTCILECRSAYVLKKAWYHYRINPASATHSGNPSYLLCVDGVYQYIRTLYSHPNFTSPMRQQAELYIIEMLLAGINTRLGFQTRNLLWFDPCWLEAVPAGSRVILYGSGEAGRKYRTQLLEKACHVYAGCIDFEYARLLEDPLQIQSPAVLSSMDYDYIVITVKNPMKAQQIRKSLEELGVEPAKILWFEQRDLFWRYAEAEGLLK